MKPLHEDQIHNPAWQKLCDMMWADDLHRPAKSGIWDYAVQCARDYNMELVNYETLPGSGVIFVGMCHILENIFESMPRTGSYIIVHRTNDRPFTEEMYRSKPPCVKHIYTVDSRVYADDVSAIPFGNASINGEDEIVKKVANEYLPFNDKTKLFVRYNVNPDTPHRIEALNYLKDKPFAKVITEQIPQDDFYRQCSSHEFTLALAGCGADASRQWTAIQLGSIPIVTDCPEMRHFEDLPLLYCPKNINDLTEEWLDKQGDVLENLMFDGIITTDRMRMSYWENHLTEKKKQYGIS